MKSDLTDLLLFEHHRTAAAILVSDTGEEKRAVWLPLSQVEVEIEPDLRRADRYQNIQNRARVKDNRTGFRGVVLREDGRAKCFEASVTTYGNRLWLGSFYTAEEAHEVYREAARKMHKEFYWEDNWK